VSEERALAGLKVVEYGSGISAPFCAKLMGDLGADVLKVEPPEGDEARQHGPFPGDVPHPERSGLYLYLNTNKRGVTLNLETPTGRDLFLRLLRDADVLVENNPPSAMERLGLSYPALEAVHPALVMTSITVFGQTGPYRDYRGYDIQASAMAGVTAVNGRADREPLAPPYGLMDYAGGLYGCAATLVALLERDVSGAGQQVDIATADCVAALHTGLYIMEGITGVKKVSRKGWGEVFPLGLFRCKDGFISMSAPQVAQWVRFVKIMGEPEWTRNPRYRDRRAMANEYPQEVEALMAPWLMQHTREEVFTRCREQHVPFAPVRTIDEVLDDDHLKARGFFAQLSREDVGALPVPGGPYRLSETPWAVSRPPPRLGEHNEEVFCQGLGLGRGELAALRRARII